MNEFLLANDIISGREGHAIANINGRTRRCAEFTDITATIDKNKTEVKVLGYRGTQHKATGWSGTGSATYYMVTSEWAKQVIEYARTGKDVYFDMVVVNEDPSSAAGRQEVHLMQCNIDGAEIVKVAVGEDTLTGTFSFTFADVDIPKEFSPVV